MSAGRPLGLLIGDSLMLASRNVLAGHAEASGSLAVSVAAPGCVALFGVRIFTEDPEMASDCARRKDNALPQLRTGAIKPEYAILYSRWPAYAAGPATIALGLEEAVAPAVDGDELFITALRRTIAELKSFGVRRILVLNPSPLFPRSVPNCLSLADRSGLDKARACGVDRATAEAERHKAVLRIAEALDGVADVRLADPFDAFCDASRCLPYAGDRIFFVDTNHPSDAGMEQIIAVHQPISTGPWAASHDRAELTIDADGRSETKNDLGLALGLQIAQAGRRFDPITAAFRRRIDQKPGNPGAAGAGQFETRTLVLPTGRSLKSSTVRRSTTPAALNIAISNATFARSPPRLLVMTKVSRQPFSDGCAPLSSRTSADFGAASSASAGKAAVIAASASPRRCAKNLASPILFPAPRSLAGIFCPVRRLKS